MRRSESQSATERGFVFKTNRWNRVLEMRRGRCGGRERPDVKLRSDLQLGFPTSGAVCLQDKTALRRSALVPTRGYKMTARRSERRVRGRVGVPPALPGPAPWRVSVNPSVLSPGNSYALPSVIFIMQAGISPR